MIQTSAAHNEYCTNETPRLIGNGRKKFRVRQVDKINSHMTIHRSKDVSVTGSNPRSSLVMTSGRQSLMTLPRFDDQSTSSFNQILRAFYSKDVETGTSQEAKRVHTHKPTQTQNPLQLHAKDGHTKIELIPVYRNSFEDLEKQGTLNIETFD